MWLYQSSQHSWINKIFPCLFQFLDYALQVRPVTFLQEPTSRIALVGSSVTFSCNTSIAPLVSNYPLPTLTWRFNGSAGTQSSWKVTSNSGEDGYSELHIENVTEGNAGYYECVSSDGGGNYITVSRRAWLTVVSKYIIPSLFRHG